MIPLALLSVKCYDKPTNNTNRERLHMIDHNSAVPMYIQLANLISDAIYQGEYRPGDKLPSENMLCRAYSVSRITVRQALNFLIQQGLVFSVHGKGTFVKTPAISHELNKIVSFSRVLQLKGLKGHTCIQSFQPKIPSTGAYALLGSEVANLNLLGYASESPIVYYCSYFRPVLGEKMRDAAMAKEQAGVAFSTYDLYEEAGVSLSRVEQTISAINATAELAHILELSRGKALIVLESIYYSVDGTPLEYKTGYYRSDIYSFHLLRQV